MWEALQQDELNNTTSANPIEVGVIDRDIRYNPSDNSNKEITGKVQILFRLEDYFVINQQDSLFQSSFGTGIFPNENSQFDGTNDNDYEGLDDHNNFDNLKFVDDTRENIDSSSKNSIGVPTLDIDNSIHNSANYVNTTTPKSSQSPVSGRPKTSRNDGDASVGSISVTSTNTFRNELMHTDRPKSSRNIGIYLSMRLHLSISYIKISINVTMYLDSSSLASNDNDIRSKSLPYLTQRSLESLDSLVCGDKIQGTSVVSARSNLSGDAIYLSV
jgi:hypothetical protein